MSRIHAWSTACLVVLCAAGLACTRVPPQPTQGGAKRVDEVLAEQAYKDDLRRFAGRPPSNCVISTQTTELCEWQLGNRHAGWASLAEAIDTDDQVNLICDLPRDGGPRARGSCTAHPRRSNRGQFPIPASSGVKRSTAEESPSQARARYRRLTNQALARARTLPQLARLMGAIPNECLPNPGDSQVCLWRTTNRTYGHGTLAMSIGAPKRKRVRMQCRLPTDGSERAPDSCFVEVGG
jgi:hypothetical protein